MVPDPYEVSAVVAPLVPILILPFSATLFVTTYDTEASVPFPSPEVVASSTIVPENVMTPTYRSALVGLATVIVGAILSDTAVAIDSLTGGGHALSTRKSAMRGVRSDQTGT